MIQRIIAVLIVWIMVIVAIGVYVTKCTTGMINNGCLKNVVETVWEWKK